MLIIQKTNTNQTKIRQPYSKPSIIHELELETRAGSGPQIGGSPDDPLGLGFDLTNP